MKLMVRPDLKSPELSGSLQSDSKREEQERYFYDRIVDITVEPCLIELGRLFLIDCIMNVFVMGRQGMDNKSGRHTEREKRKQESCKNWPYDTMSDQVNF